MSAKAVSEKSGKSLLYKYLNGVNVVKNPLATYRAPSEENHISWDTLAAQNPWVTQKALVAKPDQLIKRRGKLGLIKVNADFKQVKQWVDDRAGKDTKVGSATGKLKTFLIEPFVPHAQDEECYISIYSHRNGDTILFHHQGGVDVGDVDAKAAKLEIPIDGKLSVDDVKKTLLVNIKEAPRKESLTNFVVSLYNAYVDLFFTYLEINPLVVSKDGKQIYVLDLAAKIDETASFACRAKWGDELEFPPPFGRDLLPEEKFIADLDSKSGASLKLTILNKNGRIWTMVAGGGASVIYSDTICDLGGASELANYGEYSGAPSESQTYDYAKTILGLMTAGTPRPEGKVLIIGGSIANFTNVAATFKGIVKALQQYQTQLQQHKVSIYIRRGGPNYQEGLRIMKDVGSTLGVPIYVFGPETHMTAVVGMALGQRPVDPAPQPAATTANFLLASGSTSSPATSRQASSNGSAKTSGSIGNGPVANGNMASGNGNVLFTKHTKAIVWGMQQRAVQSMLDYDYVCERTSPSVVAITYPMTGDHKMKFYFGHKEILIPVYKSMEDTMKKHPDASVLVNFASLRSAYETSVEALKFPQIRCLAVIAEGIPENWTRSLIKQAYKKGVTVIGPATVGGIKPGCFKIGNTGGMMDNILASKLYRPGSVAYVSRSGGMSNELNNIISLTTDGVIEGVAIGGDRYPGTTFMDHLLRYEADPEVKMLVLLGEVGGVEEYAVCEALKTGKIKKPLVAWCIGTCATMFTSDVQFGHAGACANADQETAVAKNKALHEAGAAVPKSFDDLGEAIGAVYNALVKNGIIVPGEERPPPPVPMDYSWARELGLIRKPASFMTTICDERGSELLYAGMPITKIFEEQMGIGGVLGLLWFQRRLPQYASKFIEMCLMVTADHGPAVSGAHNTIVCARAGKDLVSSLASGLLTIGDRFGGALDEAGKQFSAAFDGGLHPTEFVNKMRKDGKLIMGIGHRVKSLNNPDMRVVILKEYAKKHFPQTPLVDYALEVEKVTTAKKPNLILNVDGIIGTAFVDLLRHCGCFTPEEANEYVEIGTLNGLFVLGRTMGFIGHYLDQNRLKQGLYRHPWDDITYVMPEHLINSDQP